MPTPHSPLVDPARTRVPFSRASRRTGHAVLGAALASALATTMLTTAAPARAESSAGAGTTSAGAAAFEAVTPRRSEEVVDAYGIGVHTAYWSTPYGDTGRLVEALNELGVEHLRDDLWNNTPRSYVDMNRVARETGAKYTLILGNPSRGQAPKQYIDTVAREIPDAVEMLEGPNEVDNFGGSDWVAETRDFQAELYAAAKANPVTASMPMLAPSLAWRENYDELGTQTGVADIGNSHLYPGGRKPSVDIAAAHQASESHTGTTSTIVTEAGYHNAVNTTGGHHPTPEDVSATYLPRMLAEHVLAGTQRLFTYELIDQVADPDRTDQEANFGLLRHDWSPKPAFVAMKNLLGLLDDSESAFATTPLAYRTSGSTGDLRQVLTQRSDGTHVLLLWRDVTVWSTGQRQRLDIANTPITVSLPEAARIAVHEPNVSATPTTLGTGTDVTIPMRGQLVALEISDPDPGLPELPDVTDIDVTETVASVVDQVLATPLPRGARVSWTVDDDRDVAPRTSPDTWNVRVFRDDRQVRTLTRPGSTSSVKVTNLSPRSRYRFEVVAGSEVGPLVEPTVSRYVKPRRSTGRLVASGQRAPAWLNR